MLQLPTTPDNNNERALAQVYRERFTGLTGTALTLLNTPARTADDTGLERVFKNGALLDPAGGAGGYSITGKAITLGTALIAGDVVVVHYWYRGGV